MFKRIAIIFLALSAVWITWRIFMPPKVIRVDGRAVYVENFPLMTKEKIEWWKDNKYLLQKKYGLIENPENFIVIIMRFNGYKSLPAGTRSGNVDDYRCFDDIKDRNNCIYNDMAMIVSGDINKKIFYRLDNKLYSETPDGALTLLRE